MKRLRVPARLVYTVLFTACASPGVPADVPAQDVADAPSDLASDVADALTDARTDNTSDVTDAPSDVTDAPSDVADVADVADAADGGCVMSAPFEPPGIYCGNGPSCPNARVCTAADCPAGCPTCTSPLFCIPDNTRDATAPPRCAFALSCVGSDCGPDCRSVG